MAINLKQAQNMQHVSRRNFLDKILVGAGVFSGAVIAGSVGSVLAGDNSRSSSASGSPGDPSHEGMAGMSPTEAPSTAKAEPTAAEMDARAVTPAPRTNASLTRSSQHGGGHKNAATSAADVTRPSLNRHASTGRATSDPPAHCRAGRHAVADRRA